MNSDFEIYQVPTMNETMFTTGANVSDNFTVQLHPLHIEALSRTVEIFDCILRLRLTTSQELIVFLRCPSSLEFNNIIQLYMEGSLGRALTTELKQLITPYSVPKLTTALGIMLRSEDIQTYQRAYLTQQGKY